MKARILQVLAVALAMVMATMAQAGQLQQFGERPEAPEIVLENLDGEVISLADFRGRVVIVNFWATWCPPCRKEMPSMQRAWQELRENGVVMLAVHVGGTPDQVWEFASEFGLDFPIVIDTTSKVSRSWPMRGLPTTFVIDPGGRIAYFALGAREWDDPDILQTVYALKG